MQEGTVRDKVTSDGQVVRLFPKDVVKVAIAPKKKQLDKEK